MNKLRLARFFLFFFKLIPLRHKLRSNQDTQPFFVLGSGRNGSTLLNRILNESPEVFLPPEQYFLGPAIFKYHFYNYFLWNDLAKVIVSDIFLKEKETWDFDPTGALLQSVKLPKKDRSLQSVISAIFNSYGAQFGKGARWGDTTPLNANYAAEIFKLYPKGKFVFLLRDGRDVAASYKLAGGDSVGINAQIKTSTSIWIDSTKVYQWLRKRTEVLLIKYEDLVVDTDKVLSRICDFIEVEEIPNWRNYVQNIPTSKFYSKEHLAGIKKEVFSASIGKWEEVLTDEEKNYVNDKMGKELSFFGYLPQKIEK